MKTRRDFIFLRKGKEFRVPITWDSSERGSGCKAIAEAFEVLRPLGFLFLRVLSLEETRRFMETEVIPISELSAKAKERAEAA